MDRRFWFSIRFQKEGWKFKLIEFKEDGGVAASGWGFWQTEKRGKGCWRPWRSRDFLWELFIASKEGKEGLGRRTITTSWGGGRREGRQGVCRGANEFWVWWMCRVVVGYEAEKFWNEGRRQFWLADSLLGWKHVKANPCSWISFILLGFFTMNQNKLGTKWRRLS